MTATSEAIVIWNDLELITPGDLNATNALARGTTDNLVAAFMASSLCYSGLAALPAPATGGAVTKVIVDKGLLYDGAAAGQGYALRAPFSVDLGQAIAAVPADTTAKVLILARGFESESDAESRTLLDAKREPTNPEDYWPSATATINTRITRTAVIEKLIGTAAVQPQDPSFSPTLCLIATVTISPAGVTEVLQNTAARITRLDDVADEASDAVAGVVILKGDLARLLSTVSGLALQLAALPSLYDELAKLQARIKELESRQQAGTAAVFRGQDLFTDESQSRTSAAGYSALVASGLRFPAGGGTGFVPIVPQNAYAGGLSVIGNLILPAYTEVVSTPSSVFNYKGTGKAPVTSTMAVAGTLSAPLIRRAFGVQRTRWGRGLAAESTAEYLSTGDPTRLFSLGAAGDFSYDLAWGPWQTPTTDLQHKAGFYRDLTSRGPWSRYADAPDAVNGWRTYAQIYGVPGTEMITSIDFELERGYPGAVMRLLVTDVTPGGAPDLTRIYGDTTQVLPQARGIVKFTLPSPVLKLAGKKLAFVFMVSDGRIINRYLANIDYSADANYTNPAKAFAPGALNGTVLTPSPDGNWVGTPYREISIRVNRASFGTLGSVRVPMQALNLAVGIDSLDMVLPCILPPGCAIDFETAIGGQVVPIGAIDKGATHPLTGGQQTLPLTMILTFGDTVAPILNVSGVGTGAYASLAKSGTAFNHFSAVRSPSVPVTKVVEVLTLDAFAAATSTITARLQTGAGFATETAPSTVTDEPLPGGGIARKITWLLGQAVTDHAVRLAGAITDQTKPFVVRRRDFSAEA